MGFLAGWPAVGPAAVFVLLTPINFYLAQKQTDVSASGVAATEARTAKVMDMVNGIRVIKFFGWESKFATIIERLRVPEMQSLHKSMGISALLALSVAISQPAMQVVLFVLIGIKSGEKMDTLLFYQCISLVSIVCIGACHIPGTPSTVTF